MLRKQRCIEKKRRKKKKKISIVVVVMSNVHRKQRCIEKKINHYRVDIQCALENKNIKRYKYRYRVLSAYSIGRYHAL
jgi:hypothetical protein